MDGSLEDETILRCHVGILGAAMGAPRHELSLRQRNPPRECCEKRETAYPAARDDPIRVRSARTCVTSLPHTDVGRRLGADQSDRSLRSRGRTSRVPVRVGFHPKEFEVEHAWRCNSRAGTLSAAPAAWQDAAMGTVEHARQSPTTEGPPTRLPRVLALVSVGLLIGNAVVYFDHSGSGFDATG
jgi:hypothetical protein